MWLGLSAWLACSVAAPLVLVTATLYAATKTLDLLLGLVHGQHP